MAADTLCLAGACNMAAQSGTICEVCRRGKVKTTNSVKLCEACKRFFRRVRATEVFSAKCLCNKICPPGDEYSSDLTDGADKCPLCRPCRARKLRQILLGGLADEGTQDGQDDGAEPCDDSGSSGNPAGVDVRLIPCEVCRSSSSGFHYGVMTCEGCKGFFRRVVLRNRTYNKCKFEGSTAHIDIKERINECKHCRFKACLECGMSVTGIRKGRRSASRRLDVSLYIQQLADNSRLLRMPIQRRIRPRERNNSAASLIIYSPKSPSLSDPGTSTATHHQQLEIPPIVTQAEQVTINFEAFMQQLADAEKSLVSTRSIGTIDLTSGNFAPPAIWQMAVGGCIETNVKAVSFFLRNIPGFHDVDRLDKRKMFTNSFYPIIFAKLLLDNQLEPIFSVASKVFGLQSAESSQIFDAHFPYVSSILNQKLMELGSNVVTAAIWNQPIGEFALFSALLFFNSETNGIVHVDSVMRIQQIYYEVYKESVRRRISSCSVDLWSQQPSIIEMELAKISELLNVFRSATSVFAEILQWTASYAPDTFTINPIWGEMWHHLRITRVTTQFET